MKNNQIDEIDDLISLIQKQNKYKNFVKKGYKDKGLAQLIHAQKRIFERFGKKLSLEEIEELVQEIQKGNGDFVKKQSNRTSVWKVNG